MRWHAEAIARESSRGHRQHVVTIGAESIGQGVLKAVIEALMVGLERVDLDPVCARVIPVQSSQVDHVAVLVDARRRAAEYTARGIGRLHLHLHVRVHRALHLMHLLLLLLLKPAV